MRGRIIGYKPLGFRKGQIALELDGDFRNQYDKLKDCDVSIEIEKYSENRSLKANAYLWSLITKIGNALRVSKDEIYLDMLEAYGQGGAVSIEERFEDNFVRTYKYHEYLGESELNGKVFKHYRFWVGSSEYSQAEFAILLDGVIDEAKQLGIDVKSPEEIESLLGEFEC